MHAVLSKVLRFALCFFLITYLGFNCAAAADIRYSNPEYGFSILIPEVASRSESKPPAPQHGVAIGLPSGGRMWIDGSYDTSFHGSAEAALKQLLEDEGANTTRPLRKTKVANLAAAGASYSKAKTISTRVVAYRPRDRDIAVIYTFGLDTTRAKENRDKMLFEKIVRSFVMSPLPE